ncbi:ATP-binding protein [Psychrobacter sp. CAL346-MNA-CIBAN-0220]|uniref:sensor histidine kinase n=1 Tax=Psychrobacter sp. CAL346-MNA-CIBAN-0220 TaxID=3140457 RepID=UPI003320101E
MILITSTLAIVVERWLNEQELATRMDTQIEKLLAKRELLATALQLGDMTAVKKMYEDDRRLMNQIRIYDEQGAIIFPRYRDRKGQRERRQSIDDKTPALPDNDRMSSNKASNNNELSNFTRSNNSGFNKEDASNKRFTLNNILQPIPLHKAIADTNSRSELADIIVALPDEQTVIIQLRPHLLFKDVLELQRSNFTLRLGLIILFSVLVCFWLSRTMTQRIRYVQHTVHRMIDGDYQASPNLSKLGRDELGLLAKDVAQLSTRLADSELARKQMLSDISHELRSPLARLDVATELTRDFAPHASRYLDRIDKESVRMNELIEQIIRIQSLQMQQYTINSSESEAVDVAEIISEIGQDVCFEFQHKHVHWQWQSSETSWTVVGNQEQLHSALENVIRNAFMHTPPNSIVTAAVMKVQIDKDIEGIQISISDEGGGVADKDLERIFQPFVRLDSARHRQTGGYGLGLAIVHAIVMAHKGKLTVYNRQDGIQGLVVQIVLPVSF